VDQVCRRNSSLHSRQVYFSVIEIPIAIPRLADDESRVAVLFTNALIQEGFFTRNK
jgi:hypothetical protein